MRYSIGLITLTLLAICLPVVAFANADATPTRGLPEWVSAYPGAKPRIKSSIENSPGLDITFAFATDDAPERVAEFYTQKLQVAGLNPAIERSHSADLIELLVKSSGENSPQVKVTIQAAPWLTGSLPNPGKRTKVSISYNNVLLASQSVRWDEALPITIILVVALVFLGFWLWMLIDCAMKEPNEGNTKLVWIGIILIAQFIGAFLYFFIRRPERRAALGR